jgi:ABC-2 type transport system permease protein
VSSHPAAALWYLTRTSARNRMRAQLARLRQPRYLVALVVGGAYLYWAVGVSANDPENPFAKVGDASGTPLLLAAALLFTSAWWWLGRPDRTALAFSPAEVHLLFPAPLSRRSLVHTKLLRSQAAILLNVLIWVVLLRGGGATLAGWQRGLALWILFSTFTLHRLAAALVRINAEQHDGAGRRRAIVPVGIFTALFGSVGWVLWQARTPLTAAWSVGITPTLDALRDTLTQPIARLALAPVQALVLPIFAATPADWLLRMGPALLVLGLHYAWVVRTDAAFEEAALEASQERARRLARMTGSQLSAKRSRKGGVPRIPPLPAWGPTAIVIAWKNMAAAIRGGDWTRQLLTLFGIFAGTMVVLRSRSRACGARCCCCSAPRGRATTCGSTCATWPRCARCRCRDGPS